MLRFTTLIIGLFISTTVQSIAETDDGAAFRSTWVLEVSAQICMVNERDVCILKSATYALNNPALLQHMNEHYPDKIDWFQNRFEQSSYSATKRGRSIFRRILAENAIETLESFFGKFKAENDPDMKPADLNNRSAMFHFIRAQSCAEQQDNACAVESLRIVRDVMASGDWDDVIERYSLEEPSATQAQKQLLKQFSTQL
jgi:hypothetical protein